jgi:hypothetical protein
MPPQLKTMSPLANAWRRALGDARAVVAHVAHPRQRQAARRQQFDHLGHVLVLALAGQDLVTHDDQAELRGRHATNLLS